MGCGCPGFALGSTSLAWAELPPFLGLSWAPPFLGLGWAPPLPWPGLSSPLSLASALPFLGLVWAQPPWPELGSPPSLGWAAPFLGLSHGPTRDLTLNCFNLLSPQSKQKYQKLAKRQQTHSSAQLIA